MTAAAAAPAAMPRTCHWRARGSAVLAISLLLAGLAVPARAQGGCAAAAFAAERAWPAPLDRTVTLRARDVTLRDALDRLSAAAGVRLSYTSEALPLDRRVCVAAERVPLGDALARLVGGAGAEPVVVAGQVVLAPAPPRRAGAAAAPEPERESTLERIVVTGTPAGAARRGLAVGLDVIDGPELSRRSATSLAEVMNGTVPGMWMWRRSPSDLLGQYGSVRGASSFVATYPKVYIDGVEVANPLVVTQIDPDLVERVEVIRGPQGAALYGSDAISGVINIVTRHDGGAGMRAEFRTEAGAAGSDFASRPVPTHRERLSIRAGTNLRSMAAAVTVGGTGAVYPDAGSRTVSALATGRWVAPRAIFTGTFRFYGQTAGAGRNPLLPILTPPAPGDTAAAQGARYGRRGQMAPGDSSSISPTTTTAASQGMRQYTAGVNAAITPPGRWSFTFLAGIDGYRLNRVADTTGPFPAALDPTLRAGSGAGDRATLRAGGSKRLLGDGDMVADLSVAVEHSVLREQTTVAMVHPREAGETWAREGTEDVVRWRHDTGALAQVSGAWRNTLFGTAGVRLERNDALGGAGELSTLPMLGAAWVRAFGASELKLRAAYGRGIRPPSVPARENLHVGYPSPLAAALEPETQSGFEFGAELYLRRGTSFQVTRFDQRASGLIQDVVAGIETTTRYGRAEQHVRYVPQNLGSITNRGWEMQGRWRGGPLSLTGALSFVDSRVRSVAPGYGGDLRPGDRMLGVPARTAGLTAEWTGSGWTGALTASRAWDWTSYDRAALAAAFAQPGGDPGDFNGEKLRAFWRQYHGSTNLRATGSRQVAPRVWFVATGDNLLGRQLGEPDNVTIRPGRTLTVGIRTSF
ncbi:TonB-dependent receptor plug domain-containing protein [Longimicrobium sp.]|uniref:TonB-dependent receptor plug domain-containing protein n=1 Tax=Longimicrobium sp. TaxID=2029185 RepID=UPI002C261DF2|nr:TonB-dependent receptor plug domain-containing protein [Longimicrobium sp.]HSU17556.1 TonB-dependent receptor plug domain-containing protein [Longimicrobium sp.]